MYILRPRAAGILYAPPPLYSQRGRGVTGRGVTAKKVLRGFQRFSESDFLFKMLKKVLRSAEKFSEPFPLSPLPLYPSPFYTPHP